MRVLVSKITCLGLIFLCAMFGGKISYAQDVSLKALGRFEGWRDNALIGYGLVVGLSGSGDSARSGVTKQTLQNVYSRLGVTVEESKINSRNSAIVIVTGTLPASGNVGDKISVIVASAGDARSLAGGTLLMTPLLGPDRHPYALAQGPLLTGGYNFESASNFQQRNYPTTARLEMGATIETAVDAKLLSESGNVVFYLNEPSFTTAQRISQTINQNFRSSVSWAKNADEVRIKYNGPRTKLTAFLSKIESLKITPDRIPRIVINERTGTVVAGGDVTVSSVVISQGDIKITVTAENYASQPSFIAGFANDISSLVVTNTELSVDQGTGDVVAKFDNTTVADLVQGLSKANVDTRRIISVLQAMKAAGALHSEIIVQ